VNDPNITHSVKKYRRYASMRMTHADPPIGSISALILKKKSGIGTRASRNEDSWRRFISVSDFNCVAEESDMLRLWDF
jgi:hypothetical protein